MEKILIENKQMSPMKFLIENFESMSSREIWLDQEILDELAKECLRASGECKVVPAGQYNKNIIKKTMFLTYPDFEGICGKDAIELCLIVPQNGKGAKIGAIESRNISYNMHHVMESEEILITKDRSLDSKGYLEAMPKLI